MGIFDFFRRRKIKNELRRNHLIIPLDIFNRLPKIIKQCKASYKFYPNASKDDDEELDAQKERFMKLGLPPLPMFSHYEWDLLWFNDSEYKQLVNSGSGKDSIKLTLGGGFFKFPRVIQIEIIDDVVKEIEWKESHFGQESLISALNDLLNNNFSYSHASDRLNQFIQARNICEKYNDTSAINLCNGYIMLLFVYTNYNIYKVERFAKWKIGETFVRSSEVDDLSMIKEQLSNLFFTKQDLVLPEYKP
jgi:hypothetical protein